MFVDTALNEARIWSPISRYTIPWVCDASGDYSEYLTDSAGNRVLVRGTIQRVDFIPGAGGDQPTNAYDVTLIDENGVDAFIGIGGNLSNAAAVTKCPGVNVNDGVLALVPAVVCNILKIVIANAGNVKKGTVVVYLS